MILIIEDPHTLESLAERGPSPRPGTLQRTLRRMGFHAARPSPRRAPKPRPPAAPARQPDGR
jgi:hypothetical protein